jgi:hypothetical protein
MQKRAKFARRALIAFVVCAIHVCQQFGPIGAVTNCASPVLLDYGHGWDRNELIPPAECLLLGDWV